MNNYEVINYDEKNILDYKNLSQLLYDYHSGMSMNKESIYAIAQATPTHRIMSMNLSVLNKVGIHDEYGSMNSEKGLEYGEKLGRALVNFYYGYRNMLTQEELLMIATLTDEEKLDYIEEYSKSIANLHATIRTSELIDRIRYFDRENTKTIDFGQKNVQDYEYLKDKLYLYHSGMTMDTESLDVIAQATPTQRIMSMNLSVLNKIGIHDEYGSMNSEKSLEYGEKVGKALVNFYYGYRNVLTQEELFMIVALTDEEKLDYIEEYSRSIANPYASIRSVDLITAETVVKSSKIK